MTNEEKLEYIAKYRESLSYEEMLVLIKAEAVFQLGKIPTPQTMSALDTIYNRLISKVSV
jgi:hypothetical protein